MSEPILVLNCGSSSIKFALFDAAVQPLARKALWSGQVDGIGKDKPYSAALQELRASVVKQTGGRPPAAVVHRVVHGGTRYSAPVRVDAAVLAELKSYIPLAPLHQPFALQAIEVLLAELPETAAGRVLRHRVPSHARAGRADAAAAACALGTRRAALRLSRPVVRVHGSRARRAARRCRARAHDRRASRQRREPLRDARAAQRRHHHGLFRARGPDDGHALRLARPRACSSISCRAEKLGAAELERLLYRESDCSASRACRRARRRCSKPSAPTPGRARRSSSTCAASCARSAR